MRVEVLGPVRVHVDGVDVVLNAAKERALIAALAVHAGATVSPEALIDAIWGETAPASARKTLQTYVSKLRRAVGVETVTTTPNGYVLKIERDAVDVLRFRHLVRDGEDALRAGATDRAREHLRAAVELWRGEPFGGVPLHTGLASEAARVREEYVSALEAMCAAELTAGRNAEIVGELEALVREYPYRERLWGHLIVALSRSGRQADALVAYERIRVLLRDELGLEPGGELRRIHRAVLEQEDSGDPTAPRGAPTLFRSAVRYARVGDVHVAYQVIGDGPIDLIAVPGFVSHLDMWWNAPTDTLVRRLASFSRLILFDKRGMGLSDRPDHIEVDDWVEDTRAVLDAVGSERAVVLGISAGAPTAALFTARNPDRVRSLILYGGYARVIRGDDFELGFDKALVDAFIDEMHAEWGAGGGLQILAPSLAGDASARQFWARLQTTAASPNAGVTFLRALSEVDIRDELPNISAPTLLIHAERDANTPIEGARLCRDLIPGAQLAELDSDVHLIWLSDVIDQIAAEIEEFVATTATEAEHETLLATLLTVTPAELVVDPPPELLEIVQGHGGRLCTRSSTALFDRPALAVSCGLTLASEPSLKEHDIAVAVHAGECQVLGDRVDGYTADVAAALAASADKGEVVVSRTVRDLLAGSPIEVVARGAVSMPDGATWAAFAVTAERAAT
jgi:DNA-binding SARP family transcriptional activator/pimeloyl-ACP methyl ester carboxylesterase